MTENKVKYPELSYKIVGAAFDVFNDFGFGMSEKFYQKALAKALQDKDIHFQREFPVTLQYHDEPLAKFFLDFVIEDKFVVELKVRPRMGYVHIKQVMEYLRVTGYDLAIIIYFTRDGVKYRRVLRGQIKKDEQ